MLHFFTLICVLILQSKPIVQYIVMLNVLYNVG